jgi:hypothetical protein
VGTANKNPCSDQCLACAPVKKTNKIIALLVEAHLLWILRNRKKIPLDFVPRSAQSSPLRRALSLFVASLTLVQGIGPKEHFGTGREGASAGDGLMKTDSRKGLA